MKNNISLIIAGSDSGAGAGIQADIKTFTMHSVYAATIITALTAQNTLGVQDVYDIPDYFIESQIKAIINDFNVSIIKIGMLSNLDIIKKVDYCLENYLKDIPIVLDPVMVAKGGHPLINDDATDYLIKKLLPKCYLLTPNIPEAEKILNKCLSNNKKIEENIKSFLKLGVKNILIKGGHLANKDTTLVDTLYENNKIHKYKSVFINTKNTRGTGCSLSSAITANLFLGQDLYNSVSNAQKFVYNAIKNSYQIGSGHNPINHFYKFSN